jgi:hypothetical protein
MKSSIAITLIIVAAVFSFVSGYSIGSHSDQAVGYRMASQSAGSSVTTAIAAEKASEPSAPTGGYGASDAGSGDSTATSPGYGTASPGYGSAPSPGYGQ